MRAKFSLSTPERKGDWESEGMKALGGGGLERSVAGISSPHTSPALDIAEKSTGCSKPARPGAGGHRWGCAPNKNSGPFRKKKPGRPLFPAMRA